MRILTPTILPLGDAGLLVRFSNELSDQANRATIAFAHRLEAEMPVGVVEIDPNLVSVLVKYDGEQIGFDRLAGEIRLLLGQPLDDMASDRVHHAIAASFGGEFGPHLDEVAALLGMPTSAFVARHNETLLRVLTTGFAPGFVYCGFHSDDLVLPRRGTVQPRVPAGSVLFAAGQTAIAATPIPTGWHVIGRTTFSNFDPARSPPTALREGDTVSFEAIP